MLFRSKEKFKQEHPEVARYEKATAYLAKHPDDKDSTQKELQEGLKLQTMKTRILTLTAALLLLGGFVACNDSEESEYIGTPPVTASADVSAFFKTYLPSSSSSHPEPEFNFSEIDDRDIECFVINSMEEFEAVAPPSVELPVIDFDKYTLIIGQHWMGHPGYSFEKQVVDTESDKMTLNLVYKQLKGGTPAIMTIFYFWGLYDKLPEKTLTVNKIII